MRLFDRSFWTFVGHTGRIPSAPAYTALADPAVPLAMKIMTNLYTQPGADVLDPAAVTAKIEANTMRLPKPVLAMVNLQPQRIASDAMGVPASLIAPMHIGIANALRGA